MVLKSTYHFDFRDIIFELEKVDDMEFNIVSPSPLNEKVCRRFKLILSLGVFNRTNMLYLPTIFRFYVRSGANSSRLGTE